MEQAWRTHSAMLAQRVGYVIGYVQQLTLGRENLSQQGVGGIAGPHPGEIAQGNTKAKPRAGGVCGRQQTSIEPERGNQLLRARNGSGHFRLPARGLGGMRAADSRGTARVTGLPVVLAGVG